MITQFQVLTFLNQYTPASDFDRDMITAFVEKRYRITPTTSIFALQSIFSPLNVQLYHQWYESGYMVTEIAKFEGSLVFLGSVNLEEAQIVGKMHENKISVQKEIVPVSSLQKTTEKEAKTFLQALYDSNLQFNPLKGELEAKYIPKPNEKVLFHSYDFATKGVGVVRDIDPSSGELEMYCYFIYPTKDQEARVGYSMHERNVANLVEYIFEPLLEDEDNTHKRFSDDNGISAYRRMKREIEKAGKLWRDKINRIEPVNFKRQKGETYWYINDKLEVVQDTDKGTPTAHFRYLSGNYFVTHPAALKMLDKINELMRNYLASSQWPEIE